MVALKVQLSPHQVELVKLFSWIIVLVGVVVVFLRVLLRIKAKPSANEVLEEPKILELVNGFIEEFRDGVRDKAEVLRSYLTYREILLEFLNYNPPNHLTEREVMVNAAERAESIGFGGDSIRRAYSVYEKARFGLEKLSSQELESYWNSVLKVINHVRARVFKAR